MVSQVVLADVLFREGSHTSRAQLSTVSPKRAEQERNQRDQDNSYTAELDPSLLQHQMTLHCFERTHDLKSSHCKLARVKARCSVLSLNREI